MPVPTGSEPLGRDECLALLSSVGLGRVVFTSRGLPAAEPVRFRYRDGALWFTAHPDTDLFGAAQDGVVAFEADAFDDALETGWWVTVLGRASAAGECGEPPGGARCVRIPVEVVSGRRVTR